MTSEADREKSLLEKEARFWDQQEDAIGDLYAKPHDWRFIPDIADMVIKPKTTYLIELIGRYRGRIKSVIDIGCGNGWFCHSCAEAGIKAFGVDISPKKVEAARRIAEEKGIAHLCQFEAVDIMQWTPPEKADMISAHGSLHHFPNLDEKLPLMVERFLAPGGFMLFVEPHYDHGMSPRLQDFIFACARNRFIGDWFDKEHYLQVTGQAAIDTPVEAGTAPEGHEFNLRSESPAGLEFFGAEPEMRDILVKDFELLEEKYFHCASGHLTNAFYTYMKPKWVRAIYRFFLPFIVWLDDRRCKKPKHNQWAEEGLWFLTRRKS